MTTTTEAERLVDLCLMTAYAARSAAAAQRAPCHAALMAELRRLHETEQERDALIELQQECWKLQAAIETVGAERDRLAAEVARLKGAA